MLKSCELLLLIVKTLYDALIFTTLAFYIVRQTCILFLKRVP